MAGAGPSSLQPEVLAALLARCGVGDQRALAELYQCTSAKLFGVALRILRRAGRRLAGLPTGPVILSGPAVKVI